MYMMNKHVYYHAYAGIKDFLCAEIYARLHLVIYSYVILCKVGQQTIILTCIIHMIREKIMIIKHYMKF